jgi:hypothetical protein
MVRFEKSRNGTLSAISGGIYLNSKYDPLGEARKIVREQLENLRPRIVLILGETLGYLAKSVGDHVPGCRCIQIYYDSNLYNESSFRTAYAWHPECASSLNAFLKKTISELDLGNLSILEWAPSAKAYPETAQRALIDLRHIVGIYNGNVNTTALFGKRWLRNTVHNYLAVDRVSNGKPKADLVVIAAAGPTLEESMETILTNRSAFYLIALPSSVSALLKRDLLPDLLVITDPGYYSGVHLMPVTKNPIKIAMPYTSVRDAGRYASEIVLLNQGSYLENILLKRSAMPHLQVDSHGTVAGTALLIGRLIGTSIVFAGLDLTAKDIQTHARPHAFDPLFENASMRTSPSQTARYFRGFENQLLRNQAKNIGALETYAGWFNAASALMDLPIYRLNPSAVQIDGMTPLDSSTFTALCAAASSYSHNRLEGSAATFQSAPTVAQRKTILRTALVEIKDLITANAGSYSTNLPNNRELSGQTPLSAIYFISTRLVLKAFKSMEPGIFLDAVNETGLFIDQLEEYVDSWRG